MSHPLSSRPVDATFCNPGELLVGGLLLVEILMEQRSAIVAAQLPRPRDKAAVAGYFLVLDRLCGGDERCVENGLILDLAGHVVGFFDDPVDRRAVHA